MAGPVFFRGTVVKFPENFGEITGAVKSAPAGDFRYAGKRIGQQHIGSQSHPVIQQVLDGGLAENPLEAAQTFPLSDAGRPGNVF